MAAGLRISRWRAAHPIVVAWALVAVLALLGPAVAWSHTVMPQKRMTEKRLHRLEKRILGPAHAREHRLNRMHARRERARWLRLSPAKRRKLLRASAAAVGDPATEGRWTPPFAMPAIATHAALLPTGKVMFFSQRVNDYKGHEAAAYLWDPTKAPGQAGEYKSVTPPANIWCGAQSLMADGQLLVTGGNLAYASSTSGWKGMKTVFTFDPWSETWTRQPDMPRGRWYPTQTLLPDGRTLITSGIDEVGNNGWNTDIDVFNPPSSRGGIGSIATIARYGQITGAPTVPHWYPHWFVMPSGGVLNAGFKADESWLLDVTPGAVKGTDRPNWSMSRKYGSAVLLPGTPTGSTRVMQLGGYNANTGNASVTSTEIFDEATPSSRPVLGPAMQVARTHQNTVLLPDRSIVNVGGGYGEVASRASAENVNEPLAAAGPEHRQVEILDAGSSTWRLGPSQTYKRAYHSTGLLLPDGRVLSAGDDRDPAKGSATYQSKDFGEIYEPAYLHQAGERPGITSAPDSIDYGQGFSVATTSAISSAVLVAPGATTHANDMHQRVVPLSITPSSSGTGADLTAPPSANVAPPGHYMLFVLSPNGKPSVAKWVRIGGAATSPPVDSSPPAAVSALSASPSDGSVSLSWAASSSSDVVRYDVYRTAPGARTKVSPASQGTSRTFVDSGLVNGTTYSYVVRAVDGSGNESVDSNSVSATPAASTPPPSGALAEDPFSRTVSGSWGSAATGGAWSSLAGSASGLSVDGAQGRILTPVGGVQQIVALNSLSVRDADARIAVTLPDAPSSGRHMAYLLLRRQSSGAYFRVGLVVSGSTVYLRGQTSGGTNLWTDVNTNLGFSAGTTYVLRVQAEGANPTVVRARVWRAGTPEPTTWMASNSSNTSGGPQVAGSVGVRTFNDSPAATSIRFDDLAVTRLGG